MLEEGKMGKRRDLSEFDKGQIVMAPKLQLLLGVPSLHWSISIKGGSSRVPCGYIHSH